MKDQDLSDTDDNLDFSALSSKEEEMQLLRDLDQETFDYLSLTINEDDTNE